MRIQSRLCHVSENKVVVQVNGWLKDKNLGSALAEGATVEAAEDKAISRLLKRLNQVTKKEETINDIKEDKIKTFLKDELPKSDKNENININIEPSDWSNELAAIDCEIQRLKWSREDEINFLGKTLGYNNRNKITSYKEIVNYLKLLKNIDIKNSSYAAKDNINKLIKESDALLKDLSWTNTQGREYLQKEFNVSTRIELNEKQLEKFIEKLISIRTKNLDK